MSVLPTIHDRVRFCTLFLRWMHLALAVVSGLAFLSSANLGHFQFWRQGSDIALVIIASGPMLPFLVSAIFCNSKACASPWSAAGFTTVLIAGALVMCGIYLGLLQGPEGAGDLAYLIVLQAIVYMVAAEFILD